MTETNLSPATHNLVLYRGDSVDLPLRFGTADVAGAFDVGYDLTGVVFAAQIRAKEDSAVILASFTVTLDDQTDPATVGKLALTLGSGDTDSLPGTAKWDLQATWPGATVRTYLAGKVTTHKDTTRA